MSVRQSFYDTKACSIEDKIGHLDFIKIKNICSVKGNVNIIKRQGTYGEKTELHNKGLARRIYREFS